MEGLVVPGEVRGESPIDTTRVDTLVVGLGNPILGDDGVGWQVVAEVERRLKRVGSELGAVDLCGSPHSLATTCLSLGGLSLMEHLIGCRRAIIVDAVRGGGPVGSICVLPLEDFPEARCSHVASAHDAALSTALNLGRGLGAVLPERVWIIGIVAECLDEFSEQLSPAVAAAVSRAAQRVLELLAEEA